MKYFLIAILLLLAACTSQPAVICNEPYILVGEECCLDKDGDNVCDGDAGECVAECPELDCSTCPAEVVERTVTKEVVKFVCAKDLREVQHPDDCAPKGTKATDYNPITTNEIGTVIESFSIRPACRDGFNAVEVFFEVGSATADVTLQVRDSLETGWRDLYTYDGGSLSKYMYGAFCETWCTNNANFLLNPDQAYLFRARFDYKTLYGEYQYSNEHVIDATSESEFMVKLC